jgi:hypothetical protein
MWEGVWQFSYQAVSKDEPFIQSNDFAAAAYLSGVFGEPEPDMDFEDEAMREAGIEALRQADGRVTIWSPNFNNSDDCRFLVYLVKGGKFGGKESLDVTALIAGTEAIWQIYSWYLEKYYVSWGQFTKWLWKNDPEYRGTENEIGDKNRESKKEGKGPMLPKRPEPSPNNDPGETGEVLMPTKKVEAKGPAL